MSRNARGDLLAEWLRDLGLDRDHPMRVALYTGRQRLRYDYVVRGWADDDLWALDDTGCAARWPEPLPWHELRGC